MSKRIYRPRNIISTKHLRGNIEYYNEFAQFWGFRDRTDYKSQIRLTILKIIQKKVDWNPIYSELTMQIKIDLINQYKDVKLRCACCGEEHEEFLKCDHINGGGAEHRKKVGKGQFFISMLRNGFKFFDYQVLCSNCNQCKSSIGECYHKNTHIELKDNRRAKYRLKVLSHYSPELKCACCGEDIYQFLCIDHINGGGGKQNKETNIHVYSWIIRNNYPTGFQVLCHNCNESLGAYGYCPHKPEIKREVKRNLKKSMIKIEEPKNEVKINNLLELLL